MGPVHRHKSNTRIIPLPISRRNMSNKSPQLDQPLEKLSEILKWSTDVDEMNPKVSQKYEKF